MGLFTSKSAKSKEFFAVDIGASSVKVLQLKHKGGHWAVAGIGQSPINSSVVSNKNVVNAVGLAQAISQAVETAKIKAKSVYTALPASQTISATFTIPGDLNVIEQENFVELEAKNYTPFPLEEMRMDYEVLGVSESDANVLNVHLVATKIDQFQTVVDAFSNADLEVEVMDVDSLAIVRGLNYLIAKHPLANVEDPTEVLIDLGHEFTNIFVLNKGKAIYTREQNFGMKQLVEEVSRSAGIKAEEAERQIIGNSVPKHLQSVVQQFRSETANQVNRLIQMFFAGSSFNRVHRIWLAGGGAGMSDLPQEVAELTGVPTHTVDLFEGVDVPKQFDPLLVQKLGPTFLTAFGLAIRED